MKNAIILLFIFMFNQGNAQTLGLNQAKYWDYRKTLKERYVDIGKGKGKSIPAEYFNPKKGRLHWGDGTMALGWYLGILATEYHISTKKGYISNGEGKEIDPKQTLIELSYALKALDRLDLNAETFFDKNAKGELNGFFIRDDVGSEAKANFKNIEYIDSDFTSEDPYSNEMSHDQVYELMIGLALVKNFIPEKTQVGGVFIQQQAIDQAKRILNKLQEDRWRLRNPVVMLSNGKGKKVKRGHQSYIYAGGTRRIMKFFGGDMRSPSFYDIYWSSLRMGINPTYANNSNSSMALSVAAVGNGFKKNTYRKLAKRASKNDWYFYPLLNKALYPLNREIKRPVLEKAQAMIDEAPTEGIISNYNRDVNHSWGVNNRFYKFKKYQRNGLHYQVDREYNGLDYMLFYNLWLINRTGLYMDSWRLLAPRTRKEKRAARRARKEMQEQIENEGREAPPQP